MMNILMNKIGMEIDEDTAMSSLWIFDNILRCIKQNNDDNNSIASIGEYIDIIWMYYCISNVYI